MIRVALVDDQAVIRTGLRTILEHEDDLTVVGEASTGLAALDLVPAAAPGVLVRVEGR